MEQQTTIFGSVYVQGGKEGFESYHFGESGSYISYAAVPPSWQLDDGSCLPKKKDFLNTLYDIQTRTFRGTVQWSTVNFGEDSKREYRMVFSEDLMEIEGGEVTRYDAEGKKRNKVETYGSELFYEMKLIGKY